MKKILSALFLVLLTTAVYATEAPVKIEKIIITYLDKERTSEGALRSYLDINEGQVFDSIEQLNNVIAEQEKTLKNTRYFKSATVTSDVADSPDSVNVNVEIDDGLTFIPIPYPLPDSAIGKNGWSFGLEVNYDNFFGLMSDFYFDGYANIAFGEEDKLKKWKITPMMKNIKTGLLLLDIEYTQKFDTVEVTDPNQPAGVQLLQHYTNNESFLKVTTDINLPGAWTYTIAPEIGFKYGFDYHSAFEGETVQSNNEVIEDRVNIILGQGIGLGQINWEGPLRSGYEIKLDNQLKLLYSYENQTATEDFRFVTDFDLTAKWYLPIWNRLNYYTKAETLFIVNDTDNGLGSKLRGVKNSSMYGNLGFFWLNTLGIEIWGNDSIHVQLHPFTDAGIALDIKQPEAFTDLFRIGFGADIIVMLGSIDIKAKIGYDPISDYVDFNFVTGFSY